jgi:hypothetical protein
MLFGCYLRGRRVAEPSAIDEAAAAAKTGPAP